jgi:hypothetical protein
MHGGEIKDNGIFAASKVTSFPRKRESGFSRTDEDPRLRGGDDDLTFISMGGPQTHDRSE